MSERVAPPAENGRRRGAGGRFAPGFSGNPHRQFKPGTSANPGGRPKGSKTYSVRGLWAEALALDGDLQRRRAIIEKLRQNVTSVKSVVAALESAARINREIGLGANGDLPGGVVINIFSNLRPEKLGPRQTKRGGAKRTRAKAGVP